MNNTTSEKATLKWMTQELKIDHLIPSEICQELQQKLHPNTPIELQASLNKTTCCIADVTPEACYAPPINDSGKSEFTGYLLASGEPLTIEGEVILIDYGITYSQQGQLSAYCRKFMKEGIEYYPCDESAMHLDPLWLGPSTLFVNPSHLKKNANKKNITGSEKALALLTFYYAKHSKKFQYGDHPNASKMGDHINELFDLYKTELSFSNSGLLKINNTISDAMAHLEIRDQPLHTLSDEHPFTNPAPLKEKK